MFLLYCINSCLYALRMHSFLFVLVTVYLNVPFFYRPVKYVVCYYGCTFLLPILIYMVIGSFFTLSSLITFFVVRFVHHVCGGSLIIKAMYITCVYHICRFKFCSPLSKLHLLINYTWLNQDYYYLLYFLS